MQKKKVELLAPAGNAKAFYGAIHAGADAVYLGGNRFGARAYADNFTEEELTACIRYAHLFGRKIYLTVNTLVKESEFSELYDYLCPFYAAGLDGVIVQDIGVFTYIKEQFPHMELHVSTQMTVTGAYGAELLKDMGACRVVPARELGLDEIISMKNATGLEIECFIHGAMCYCYSGQCLFSSILGGRSGNRGRCAQPCRLPYSVKGQKDITIESYPLSLKDMCTIEMLPELIEAGIDSFKIEGRMKKPEYAAGVTAIYRKYIDLYYASPNGEFKVSREDLDALSKLYIRSERQNGYYHKHNGRDMVTLDSPAYSGSDEALLTDIRNRYLDKTLQYPVSIFGYFEAGEQAGVTFIAGEKSVTVTGEVVQPASRQPISQDNIAKQLCKLGGSVFSSEGITITLGDNCFYSLKALNDLRREAVKELEELIITEYGMPVQREIPERLEQERSGKMPVGLAGEMPTGRVHMQKNADEAEKLRHGQGLHVSIQTISQLNAVRDFAYKKYISRIYINGDLFFGQTASDTRDFLAQHGQDSGTELVISMPYILRAADREYLEKLFLIAQEYCGIIKGFRVSSMEAIGFLKGKQYKGKIYTDSGFHIWNTHTLAAWANDMDGFCIPLELKGAEQRNLLQENISCEKIFYGRIPMMLTANCVAKTTDGCKKGNGVSESFLIDRYQKKFPVALNCLHCMNVIYNTVPLSLHNEWGKWKKHVAMRLDFTVESEREALAVLDFFYNIYNGNNSIGNSQPPFGEYTTGHEKRGVE